MFGKTMRLPDAAMDVVVRRCCSATAPARRALGPRDAKRALARGVVARFHGERGRGGGRAALRPRCSSSHELPEEIEEFAFAADDGAVHLPALIADALRRARARRRGGCWPRAA